jgi:hypothetical protein
MMVSRQVQECRGVSEAEFHGVLQCIRRGSVHFGVRGSAVSMLIYFRHSRCPCEPVAPLVHVGSIALDTPPLRIRYGRFSIPIFAPNGTVEFVAASALLAVSIQNAVESLAPPISEPSFLRVARGSFFALHTRLPDSACSPCPQQRPVLCDSVYRRVCGDFTQVLAVGKIGGKPLGRAYVVSRTGVLFGCSNNAILFSADG